MNFQDIGRQVTEELETSQKNVTNGVNRVKDGGLVVPLEKRDPAELYEGSVLSQLNPKRLKA